MFKFSFTHSSSVFINPALLAVPQQYRTVVVSTGFVALLFLTHSVTLTPLGHVLEVNLDSATVITSEPGWSEHQNTAMRGCMRQEKNIFLLIHK